MFPRTPLHALLTMSLLAVHSSQPPLLANAVSLCGGQQNDYSNVFQPNSSDDKYTLRGTVINSVTGEPIRGALVQIYLCNEASMLTRADGTFQLDGLPPGRCTITVSKPGFFSEESPAREPHQATATIGPNASLVVIKLVPEGVIFGRIREEDGEPIEGLPVSLLMQGVQDGRKTWEQRPSTVTDDDGTFRFAELLPGNYFLSAGPSRNPVTFPAKLSQSGTKGVPWVIYPAGSDLAASTPLPIVPGAKTEVNLILSLEEFYRVSGTISGYSAGQQVNVHLRNSAGVPLAYNPRFDSKTGAFRIPWVPAGNYTLESDSPDGQGSSLTSTAPLTVTADISGVRLILSPGVTIPIRMSVISSRTGAERFWEQEDFSPASIQLISRNAGLAERRYDSRRVEEEGAASLELQNIAPGTYDVEVSPNGPLYVQSAISGTTNLLEFGLSIAPGTSPQPIEIILRDDVASLTGTVSLENQSQKATILVISEHASVPPRIQVADPGGGFLLSFLPPGVYKILAVDSADRLEYANPEALKKYLWKAREVTLSPEQSMKIDLELVKVGE